MSTLRIGCSPLTSRIYVGKVNTKGMWIGNKVDVTDDAVRSVAENLLKTNEKLTFSANGKRYELKVVEIEST